MAAAAILKTEDSQYLPNRLTYFDEFGMLMHLDPLDPVSQ